MKKNLTHIRILEEDKKVWKEYCDVLNLRSPRLFNKILKSPNLNIEDKVKDELRKRKDLMRRLNIE